MQLVILASLLISSTLAGLINRVPAANTIRVTGAKKEQDLLPNEDSDIKGGLLWAPYVGGTTALTYHGITGSQFLNPIAYLIFYGSGSYWTTSTSQFHRTFMAGFGASSYTSNARAITGGAGPTYTAGTTSTNGNWRIASGGSLTSQALITAVFSNSLAGTYPLPKSAQGIYMVIVDPAMSTPTTLQSSSTSQYGNHWCGWHSYASVSSVTYSYGVVGSATAAVLGCAASTSYYGPNGQLDPTVSVMAHEFSEAMTDPMTNGYYGWIDLVDNPTYENGDKCAWYYGAAEYVSGTTGPIYNTIIGGTKYLLQQQYSLSANTCPRQLWT